MMFVVRGVRRSAASDRGASPAQSAPSGSVDPRGAATGGGGRAAHLPLGHRRRRRANHDAEQREPVGGRRVRGGGRARRVRGQDGGGTRRKDSPRRPEIDFWSTAPRDSWSSPRSSPRPPVISKRWPGGAAATASTASVRAASLVGVAALGTAAALRPALRATRVNSARILTDDTWA